MGFRNAITLRSLKAVADALLNHYLEVLELFYWHLLLLWRLSYWRSQDLYNFITTLLDSRHQQKQIMMESRSHYLD
nr:hypothetical protein [Tanacetum cinerariifolium]